MPDLNNYLIDIVRPAEVFDGFTCEGGESVFKPQVQLVTYGVLASSAEEAYRRFIEEEAGAIVFEGEVTDSVVVGIQIANG